MVESPQQEFATHPAQKSFAVLFQLGGVAAVWTAIFWDDYFWHRPLALIVPAVVIGGLSHLAYLGLPKRITPLVMSHVLCLVFLIIYGGVLTSNEPASAKLTAILSIASGPFAWGIKSWRTFISPVPVITLTATVLGLSFRPNLITTHLLAVGSFYWYVCGFILLIFASLGT